MARRAAINYLARFENLDRVAGLDDFTTSKILTAVQEAGGSTWKGLAAAYGDAFPGEHLEKVGLAREVIQLLATSPDSDAVPDLLHRFGHLLDVLRDTLETADLEEQERRAGSRLDRAIHAFDSDFSRGMNKTDALRVLKQIDSALGDSDFADRNRARIAGIIRDFELHDRVSPTVTRFSDFKDALRALRSTDRLTYQDDALEDPSAHHPDASASPAAAPETSTAQATTDGPATTASPPPAK